MQKHTAALKPFCILHLLAVDGQSVDYSVRLCFASWMFGEADADVVLIVWIGELDSWYY